MPKRPEHLSHSAIRSLTAVILTALAGVIMLTLLSQLLKYGVLGDGNDSLTGVADESLSILGNIASAAVGGLVGWLTRDLIVTAENAGALKEAVDEAVGIVESGDG